MLKTQAGNISRMLLHLARNPSLFLDPETGGGNREISEVLSAQVAGFAQMLESCLQSPGGSATLCTKVAQSTLENMKNAERVASEKENAPGVGLLMEQIRTIRDLMELVLNEREGDPKGMA